MLTLPQLTARQQLPGRPILIPGDSEDEPLADTA